MTCWLEWEGLNKFRKRKSVTEPLGDMFDCTCNLSLLFREMAQSKQGGLRYTLWPTHAENLLTGMSWAMTKPFHRSLIGNMIPCYFRSNSAMTFSAACFFSFQYTWDKLSYLIFLHMTSCPLHPRETWAISPWSTPVRSSLAPSYGRCYIYKLIREEHPGPKDVCTFLASSPARALSLPFNSDWTGSSGSWDHVAYVMSKHWPGNPLGKR